MRPLLPALLLLAISGATASAAAPRDQRVVALRVDSAISAYGDALAFTQRTADGQLALQLRIDGKTITAAVPPRPQRAFDVDLGTDRSGRLTVLYSRCDNDTPTTIALAQCHLYAAAAPSWTERQLPIDTPAGAQDTAPQLWRGNLLFLRWDGQDPVPSHDSNALMLADLATGTTRQLWHTPPGTSIEQADLRGDAIALTTHEQQPDAHGYITDISRLYRMTITTPSPVLSATRPESLGRGIRSPQLTAHAIYTLDPGGTMSRRSLTGKLLRRYPAPSAFSLAVTGDALLYSKDHNICNPGASAQARACGIYRHPLPTDRANDKPS